MTKNLQSETIRTTALNKSWKWEKRHWLVVIGLSCLLLWYFAPSLKDMTWFQSAISYLPVIGGLAFATDNLLKLTR